MSEFGSRPLVAGTLTGIRAFRVHGDGTLGPVTGVGRYTYTEGENVARCVYAAGHHQVAQLQCSCGFYAYHPRSLFRAYGDPTTVSARVEGYGTVTTGSRGFRAEKMRILCLINPFGGRLLLLTWLASMPLWLALVIIGRNPLGGFAAAMPALTVLMVFASARGSLVSRRQFALVRARYPGVPVHFRFTAMLRFPGKKPPKVTDSLYGNDPSD